MNDLEKFLVDVSPDMSMYGLLRNQSYQKSYALAEFIDNSIQAYLDYQKASNDGQSLAINVKIYSSSYKTKSLKNSIIIEDDAGGITKDRLKEAFKPANTQLSSKKNGFNEFGIGMKASAVWFANSWSLETIAKESPSTKYIFEFDLDKLVASNQKEIEVKPVTLFDEYNIKYGTKISLFDIHHSIDENELKRICGDLSEFYQRYTQNNDSKIVIKIFSNDTSITFKKENNGGEEKEVDFLYFNNKHLNKFLCAPRYKTSKSVLFIIGQPIIWKVDVEFEYLGKKVSGFLAILDTGSYKNNPGIIMFRNNRVVTGLTRSANLLTSSNKFAAQRVYGELNLDEFEVSFTKDAFKFDIQDFLIKLKSIESVDRLLKQSDKYRVLTDEELERKQKAFTVQIVSSEDKIDEYFAAQNNSKNSNPIQPTLSSASNQQSDEDATNIQTKNNENISTVGSGLPLLNEEQPLALKDKQKKILIKKMSLSNDKDIHTSPYCKTLIRQVNSAYEYKSRYDALIVAALRNILENHVDFCWEELKLIRPEFKEFKDKAKHLLDLVRAKPEMTKFASHILAYVNSTFNSYNTINNLFGGVLSEERLGALASSLHLAAHKGVNIISLGEFEQASAQAYTLLLEMLSYIVLYKKACT